MFDVCIIGGGTAGISAAKTASDFNFKTVLFEKNLFGGVCLNEGCVLTKTYLHALSAQKFTPENADVGEVYEKFDKIRKSFAQETKRDLLARGVKIVENEAYILPKNGEKFVIRSLGESGAQEVFESNFLIIASGSIPKRTGISFPKTNDEILEEVDIVGGGIAGFEAAEIFGALGCHVRVLEKSDKFCANLSQNAVNILATKMQKNGVEFVKNYVGGEQDFDKNAKKYFADGRKIGEISGIENLALKLSNEDKNAISTDEFCRTSHENCFAIGDVNGKSMFAHSAAQEGFAALNKIAGKNFALDYESVPVILYTNPPIVATGILPSAALEEKEKYEVYATPLSGNAMFRAQTITKASERGLFEAVVEKETQRIAGLHIIAPAAEELSAAFSLIISQKMTSEQLKSCVFAHPTIGEIIKETLFCGRKL